MAKARDAFRTISEVSDWLDTPAHVLRFWESKFTQIKPVKRAGGRRYYRPDDMALLAGIKALLHDQGMTIKGAQKILREQGVKHVARLSPPIEGYDFDAETEQDVRVRSPEITVFVSPVTKPEPAPEPEPMIAPDLAPVVAPEPVGATALRPFSEVSIAQVMPPPVLPTSRAFYLAPTAPVVDPEPVFATEPALDPVPDPEPASQPETPPVRAPHQAMPYVPEPSEHLAHPRILGILRDADTALLQRRAQQIVPLLARLQDLRDRMKRA